MGLAQSVLVTVKNHKESLPRPHSAYMECSPIQLFLNEFSPRTDLKLSRDHAPTVMDVEARHARKLCAP